MLSGIGQRCAEERVCHCKVNAGALQIDHQFGKAFSPDLRKDTALVMLHRFGRFIKSILGQAFPQLQLGFSFQLSDASERMVCTLPPSHPNHIVLLSESYDYSSSVTLWVPLS